MFYLKTLCHMWHKLILVFCLIPIFFPSQALANQFCFKEAAVAYQVNDLVLHAIAVHESRLDPSVININTNGTEDIGLTGINTVHLQELSRYGISREKLFDPCINLHVRAWLLSKKIAKYGNTWKAIGASHSETANLNQIYQLKVYKEFLKLKKSKDGQK